MIQRRTVGAACAALVLAAFGAAQAQQPGSGPMHQSMMLGMQRMQSVRPSGDTDRDFAMMMREHHRQAIEMARTQLEHGRSDELKSLAGRIIDEQQREIAQLDEWLARRK